MSPIAAPGVTGRIDAQELSTLRRYWLEDEPTGFEYDVAAGTYSFVIHFWGLDEADPPDDPALPPPDDDLRGRAASLAAATPHVAVAPPARPRLSGNLAEDVHAVCGLTWGQIADVFGISERAVAGWRTQSVPAHRAATMEALRAIGAILVGGLGPAGVAGWLTAGSPSRLQRIRVGEIDAVAAEAGSYRDTPAT